MAIPPLKTLRYVEIQNLSDDEAPDPDSKHCTVSLKSELLLTCLRSLLVRRR
jgi:hypothetical protein